MGLSGKINATVDGSPWLAKGDGGKTKPSKQQRAHAKRVRVVFVAVIDAAVLADFPDFDRGRPVAWVNGERVLSESSDLDDVAQLALKVARTKLDKHGEL